MFVLRRLRVHALTRRTGRNGRSRCWPGWSRVFEIARLRWTLRIMLEAVAVQWERAWVLVLQSNVVSDGVSPSGNGFECSSPNPPLTGLGKESLDKVQP